MFITKRPIFGGLVTKRHVASMSEPGKIVAEHSNTNNFLKNILTNIQVRMSDWPWRPSGLTCDYGLSSDIWHALGLRFETCLGHDHIVIETRPRG